MGLLDDQRPHRDMPKGYALWEEVFGGDRHWCKAIIPMQIRVAGAVSASYEPDADYTADDIVKASISQVSGGVVSDALRC